MNKPLSQESWNYRQMNGLNPGLDHFSNGLFSLLDAGQDVVAGTADLQYSNGLNRFAERYPERFVQFGISEQNMVSAAAGMAAAGAVPFVASFASFLGLLTCEQIRMDVAYCALPVRLVGHHTGISLGFYGTSHHATEDIGTTRSIAGLTVVSPSDGAQFEAAIVASQHHDSPIYFRVGRGRDPVIYAEGTTFEFGKAIEHMSGEQITVIACGQPVHPALAAARKLNADGHSIGVIDMPTIKPLDRDAILAAAARSKVILTVEEHNILGGLGAAVAEVLAEEGSPARLRRHGIKDEYALIAPPLRLYEHYKLDDAGLESVLRETLEIAG